MTNNNTVETLPFTTRIQYWRSILSTVHDSPYPSKPFNWRHNLGSRKDASFANADRLNFLDGEPLQEASPFPFNTCKYCQGRLAYYPEVPLIKTQEWRRGDAIQCEDCDWWLYAWSKHAFYLHGSVRNQIWEAAVHAFDYTSAELPITKLRKLINNGSVDLRSITPRQLEQLVTSTFRDYYGCKATHVGASRDGGIDVLLLDRDQPLAIQVKRRSTPETEGPAAIRELVGALAYRGLRRGAFVTTAETFSRQARDTASAEPLARDGYEIDLYTYDALRSIINLTSCPQRPWIDLVFDHYLSPEDVALKRAREAASKEKPGQQDAPWNPTPPNSDA